MRAPAKFWDRIAKRYSKQPVSDEAAYQHKLDKTRSYLKPDMELLEFGCGTGSTALLHAPYVKHIKATDISSNMLSIAREKAAAENINNVTFEQASFDELKEADNHYDMILGLSILHLLDNWQEVIGKVHNMLKPGGLFVSSTACIGDDMRWFAIIGPPLSALGLIPKVQVFSKLDLERALMENGFAIEYNWRPQGKVKAVFMIARKT